MLGRRHREFPSHHTETPALAAKATDLDALRTAVVDSAGVGYGLWFSYLFALLYFAIAAGAVTHRDLLLESPVKLPFLNVELPLKAFFVLGPLVFLVVHAYVLLHFLLLAGKVGAFHVQLQEQIVEDEKRAQLRRQLPSNIFVQFLAGPREVREGVVGFLLKSVASISLVAGPIALLILFQLQFLPYHSPWITWWQRVAIVLDLILLWLLWPPIARGDTTLLNWNDLGRVRVAVWLPMSLLPLLLVFIIVTFPGEPTVRFLPTSWKAWQLPSVEAIQKDESGWATLHEILVAGKVDFVTPLQELLVAGDVNFVTRRPESLWSNRLVLPGFAIGDRLKLDSENKFSVSSETVSLRGRRLEGAVLEGAHLRKTDFTGAQLQGAALLHAQLQGANLYGAQLQGARLVDAQLEGAALLHAQLQGADLRDAQLQGANLYGAQLQGARLVDAQLQGAALLHAQLYGANLYGAQLQGASLDYAQLHGARLVDAQLQGAALLHAQLYGANLYGAQLQGARLVDAQLQGARLVGAQLQGAFLRDAQLQGASLDDAQLQGAFLRDAQLQGAALLHAQLQGASLDDAQLQGANLYGAHLQGAALLHAQLQGADLDDAQLQGADLRDAQLQGASLRDVFVWRTYPPTKEYSKGALIKEPTPEQKYQGLDCGLFTVCDWKDTSYAALRASFEAVPAGPTRGDALKRVELLGKEPFEVNPVSAKEWRDLATESQGSAKTYPEELAKLLIKIGCVAEEGYVIHGLIRQLAELGLFQENPVQKAKVADAFLKEENCPGARGLSEQSKAKLRQIRDPGSSQPSPDTAAR